MILSLGFVALFLVPVAALLWRILVTKSRSVALRLGGAAAAMATLVGAVTIAGDIGDFRFQGWREIVGIIAASSGSLYLLLWSLRHRTNYRHRTVSIIAAIVGFVPVLAAVGTALIYQE
jgi:hypothetical protein